MAFITRELTRQQAVYKDRKISSRHRGTVSIRQPERTRKRCIRPTGDHQVSFPSRVK